MRQQEIDLDFKVSVEMVSFLLLGRTLEMPTIFLHDS